jgi:hypothetical protein
MDIDIKEPLTKTLEDLLTVREVLPCSERQVTVKARVPHQAGVRVWPTTFLQCKQTGRRSKLMHAENVGYYPQWKLLKANERFLMIFEPLPKDCVSFDLFEEIPEPNGFHVEEIERNNSDVYDVIV